MMKEISLGCIAVLLMTMPVSAEKGSMKISVSPVPPNLSAAVSFSEPSGNQILDADETGNLVITLKNAGKGDAFDVKAEVITEKKTTGLSFSKDHVIGTVPAGQTITKEIRLNASEDIATSDVSLNVRIEEANGFDPESVKLSFRTKAFEPPKLVVADMGVNDQSGNSRIEPMEIVEITVRVQNIGHGDARDVSADVEFGPNIFVAGDSLTHVDLGSIVSGKFKDFKFMFYTNTRIGNGEKIPITIQVGEVRPKFRASHPLDLVMNAPQRNIREIVVKGEDTARKGDIEIAGGLSVDVDTHIPEGQKAGRYDAAVIIGNRNYAASGSPDVEYAGRDARIMKEYLIHTLGFDPDNIIYAEDATLSKFNEIFGTDQDHRGRLFNLVKKGDSRVFVYYTGHGAPDLESTEAYLMPVDANPHYIKANGYRLQTFYDNLSKVPASKMTVILDACFSGNSEKGLLFKNISPAMVKVKKEFRGPANAVLITSAAVDQVSTWYPEKRHSLFTYYFLKGLQGECDTNKDRKITVGEMQGYLKENVPYMARRLSGKEQQPVVMGNEQDIIAVLKR